jgi:hypothetical protein
MSDEYDGMRERLRKVIRNTADEHARKLKAELAAGTDPERAEWIEAWLAFNKLNRARIAKEEEERSRPRYLH